MRKLWTIVVLLAGTSAAAHDADIIYAQVTRGEGARVEERLTMTAGTLLQLAPVDADADGLVDDADLQASAAAIAAGVWDQAPLAAKSGPCVRKEAAARVKETFLELNATFECGEGELTQIFRVLSVLPSNYKVVLGVYGDGELKGQAFAQGNAQTLTLLGPEAPAGGEQIGLFGWVVLGVEHIFLGIDHLAFLLAVLLVGGTWKRVLLLVTSFTLAHSITLGATALGWVNLSGSAGRWVEVAIAASIVWIALENLVLRQHRHRAILTFAFGLVHGFGFASVLMEIGLGESVVTGLLGFNLGVELGQACVVLALYPLMRWVGRRDVVNRWTIRVASGAILAAGAFWMVERVVA